MKSSSQSTIEDLTYEQAYAELEKIVAALESGENPLDASLALFERGQALSHHCASLLDKAELKVRQLSGDQLIDFEPSEP